MIVNDIKETDLLEKAQQIHLENGDFIDACEKYLKHAKEFSDSTTYFIEEALIHLEEAIVNKAEVLIILKLTTKMPNTTANISIVEETKLTLRMLENIKQTPISDENPALLALRSRLMELSFLPVPESPAN